MHSICARRKKPSEANFVICSMSVAFDRKRKNRTRSESETPRAAGTDEDVQNVRTSNFMKLPILLHLLSKKFDHGQRWQYIHLGIVVQCHSSMGEVGVAREKT